MIQYSILVVDDEQTIREGITTVFKSKYRVYTFKDAESSLVHIEKKSSDLVLLDIGLPGMNGIDALCEIKKINPEILVIMITAYEDVNTVIEAMKMGAYDYIIKPIHMDSLEVTISNALETIALRKEVQELQEQYLHENMPYFIGKSDAMQDVMEFIDLVAKSPDTPILISGETGTGKELIARAIHYKSPNFKNPLVSMNCASIPRDLLESELFGYEKGAFTGAVASGKKGLIEESEGGTLFLDEVGDLSFEAQAKLLRFLEEGEFYRVGGTKKRNVRTRVVSATNRNLDEMIENNLFRRDLYYRLGVVKVEVPSLNKRRDDIIPLAKHFLFQFAKKFNKSFTGFKPQALDLLIHYQWKGNIRELRNVVERAVLIGNDSEITIEDLGLCVDERLPVTNEKRFSSEFSPLPESGLNLDALEEKLETFYLNEALRIAKGNESKAARLLHMNHHTFRYRRKRILSKK